ncbi:hypothetical protein LXA43DRAFT_976295 [Ganoderma leucocontextum]|nr:hypothetical protein LXA43DRAFT_976295 [Ganoderma leucocontextum]
MASSGVTAIVSIAASVLGHSVHSAVHDLASFNICNLPLVSLALPSCHLPPAASVGHANFPSLLAIQHRALDELVAGSATNSELVLNVKHAELAIRDLVVLVKASNLTTKDPLADTLSQFSVNARRTGRSLQLLISKIRGTVDRAIAYNVYALHLLETTDEMPTRKRVDAAVLRSFEMALASFATSISSIIVDATMVSASLDCLEEQLSTVHALCVQEAWDTAVVEDELLWQLWTLLGGNRRQLRDLANRATVLQDVQQYRALASAYVAATVQALTVVDADLMELREQLSTQAVDFHHIPVEVQIRSLEQSLYRLKDSSASGEETGGRVNGRRLEIEKYLM